MHKSGQKDFMVFMSSVIIRLRNMERMGTLHVYQSTQNRIADFMGDRSLSFEEINPLWLQAFQAYLLGRGLNWNTISTYMASSGPCITVPLMKEKLLSSRGCSAGSIPARGSM